MEDFLAILNFLSGNEAASAAMAKLQLLVLALSLVFWILECYFGYSMLRFFISVLGFLIGAGLGFFLGGRFFDQSTYIYIAAAVLGIGLSLLSYKIYLAITFLFNGILSGLIVYALLSETALPRPAVLGISAAVLIIVGYFSVKYTKTFVIILTAVAGGLGAAGALTKLADSLEKTILPYALLAAVYMASGMLLQFLLNKGRK